VLGEPFLDNNLDNNQLRHNVRHTRQTLHSDTLVPSTLESTAVSTAVGHRDLYGPLRYHNYYQRLGLSSAGIAFYRKRPLRDNSRNSFSGNTDEKTLLRPKQTSKDSNKSRLRASSILFEIGWADRSRSRSSVTLEQKISSPGLIYEDSTATVRQDFPFYNFSNARMNESEGSSPIRAEGIFDSANMKLRETSLNPKTPSPIRKTRRTPPKGASGSKAAALEQAKYVDHIEAQLAAAQTELRSYKSPTILTSNGAKLRALSAENKALKKDIADWELKFSERVAEETSERQEYEAGLKAKLRVLEQDAENRTLRLVEMEAEIDNFAKKSEELRAVEKENASLQRRLDILTELLGQSPSVGALSPVRASYQERRPRLGRPQSHYQRLSSDETPMATRYGKRHSLSISTGVNTSPRQHSSSASEDHIQPSPKNKRHSQSFSNDWDTMGSRTSVDWTSQSMSRPSSILSDSSTSAFSWNHALPPLIEVNRRESSRQRRMRRFPGGAGGPKTLILPATSTPTSTPMSAPPSQQSAFPWGASTHRDSLSATLPTFDSLLLSEEAEYERRASLLALEANSARYRDFASPTRSLRRAQTSRETPSPRMEGESLASEMSRVEDTITDGSSTASPPEVAPSYHLPVPPVQSPTLRRHSSLARRKRRPTSDDLKQLSSTTAAAAHQGFLLNFSVFLAKVWQNPAHLALMTASSTTRITTEAGYWVLSLLLGPFGSGGSSSEEYVIPEDTAEDIPHSRNRATHYDWHRLSSGVTRSRAASVEDSNERHSYCNGHYFVPPGASPLDLVLAEKTCPLEHTRDKSTQEAPKLDLWMKFAVAIVMAIGVAIKDGPQSAMASDKNRLATLADSPFPISDSSYNSPQKSITDGSLTTPKKKWTLEPPKMDLHWEDNLGIEDFSDHISDEEIE
jgi:hypothetical protein